MSDQLDVVTFGELLGVISPFDQGSTLESTVLLERSLGGAEVNIALALARLGHRVGWAGVVGDDPFGRDGLRTLRGEGVDVSRTAVDPLWPTGIYFKEMLPLGGVRNYPYREASAASRATYADVDVDYALSGRVLHMTGITALISDAGHDLVTRLMTAAAATDVHVSFDVNIRNRLLRGRDPAHLLRPLSEFADVIFASRDEAALLFSTDDLIALQSMLGSMAATALIVHDVHGAIAVTDYDIAKVDARAVNVVDPTGAGDALAAGYLSGWLDDAPSPAALSARNAAPPMPLPVARTAPSRSIVLRRTLPPGTTDDDVRCRPDSRTRARAHRRTTLHRRDQITDNRGRTSGEP